MSQNPPRTQSLATEPPVPSNGALQSRAVPAPPQQPVMSSSTPRCPQPRAQPGGSCASPGGRSSTAGTVLSPKPPPSSTHPWVGSSSWAVPVSRGSGNSPPGVVYPKGDTMAFISAGNGWKSNPAHSQSFFSLKHFLSVSKGEGFICRVGARESISHSPHAAPQVNKWHGDREWQWPVPSRDKGSK